MPFVDGTRLLECGFRPMRYDPFALRLVALEGHRATGKALYVRLSPALKQRLREASAAGVLHVVALSLDGSPRGHASDALPSDG
ncbi:MAG: hypothetical protein KAG72_00945 [Abyssibacter sp.]|nr:hypothetical protein [Abyssibacter sp.]